MAGKNSKAIKCRLNNSEAGGNKFFKWENKGKNSESWKMG